MPRDDLETKFWRKRPGFQFLSQTLYHQSGDSNSSYLRGLPLRIKSFSAHEVICSEQCLARNKHLMNVLFFSTFRSFCQLPSSYFKVSEGHGSKTWENPRNHPCFDFIERGLGTCKEYRVQTVLPWGNEAPVFRAQTPHCLSSCPPPTLVHSTLSIALKDCFQLKQVQWFLGHRIQANVCYDCDSPT